MFTLRNTVLALATLVLASSVSAAPTAEAMAAAAAPAAPASVPRRRSASSSGSLAPRTTTSTTVSTSVSVGTISAFGFSTTQEGVCYNVEESFFSSIGSTLFGGGETTTTCICVGYNGYVYSSGSLGLSGLSSSELSSLAQLGGICAGTINLFSFFTGNECTQACTIPVNSTPNPSSSSCCAYTCTYGTCGSTCLASGQVCVSGVATTPKTVTSKRSLTCPQGMDRCPISNTQFSAYECVNAASDIYSCGGCIYGDAEDSTAPTGQDCSQIPNVSDVTCVGGSCVIESCESGYELVPGQGCVYSEKVAFRLQKYRL